MRVPLRTHDDGADEAGFTMVETLVAIILVSVGLFALMGELAAYLRHQATEKSRAAAVRVMTTTIEHARLNYSNARSLNGTYAGSVTMGGKDYATSTEVQHCTIGDVPPACTTPASTAVEDLRVRTTVTWNDSGKTHSLSNSTSVADKGSGQYTPTGSGTLSTLLGGTSTGSVSVTAFTASPTSTTVSTAGQPASPVTLSLTTVGLTSSTTAIPVTWTDDNGGHQISLTGGPATWNATVPASSMKKVVTSGTDTLTFAASVPGVNLLPTVSVTLRPTVAISSCSVTPSPIVLTVLTRKTSLPEILSCNVTGLSATDSVTVAYTSASSTVTKTLTSSNGTSWSVTLAAGTVMVTSGSTETFTFTATRAVDGQTASASVSAALL